MVPQSTTPLKPLEAFFMAAQLVRLRRTLMPLSSLNRIWSTSKPTVSTSSAPINSSQIPTSFAVPSFAALQSRLFRSSTKLYKFYQEGEEITPETVLFEGCDFNHWLITVNFPKDNKPPPDAMVRTYEEICAQGLGISIEEAKKRIYACSTTTYEGFQAIMTEEESEKFKDVPEVVFVLPDSYIDPVNKEYGGDKYENGVITHRPPPIQYGRTRGRPRYQSRNYEQQGSTTSNWRGSPSHSQPGPMQGDGVHGTNYGPPQSNYQQGFGAQQHMNRDSAPGGRAFYPADRSNPPPYQGNYSQTGPRNYNQGDRRQFQQWDQANNVSREQNPGSGQSYSRNQHQGGIGPYGQGLGPDKGQGPSVGANSAHGDGQKFS